MGTGINGGIDRPYRGQMQKETENVVGTGLNDTIVELMSDIDLMAESV